VPDADSLDLTDNFTFEAWVFPVETSHENMIFNKEQTYQWAIINGTLRWALETSVPWIWHDTGIPIPVNQWTHLALTYDSQNVTVYGNGILLSTLVHPQGGNLKVNDSVLCIGARSLSSSFFAGQLDEVCIWNIARTPEEIQATMHTTLKGKEQGLVGYWQFDDFENIATDSSLNHSDGKLIGDAHFVEEQLPKTVISGTITDEAGKLIANALVQLEQDGEEIAKTQANGSGNYSIAVYSPRGSYDLSVTSGEKGVWQLGIRLYEGERRNLNLTLKESISISGTLLMLDNRTPHVATVVQAVIPPADSEGEPVLAATTLSDEAGRYRFLNLKPGRYQVRCYIPGEYLYYGAKTAASQGAILQVERGRRLNNIDFRFPPFKKGVWRHYTRLDGLVHNTVNKIYVDSEGFLWLGTDVGGISRFDGREFLNFTAEDGLPPYPCIWAIHQDADGMMWFGLWENGVYRGVYPFDNPSQAQDSASSEASRREGKEFAKFAREEEGLAHANVLAIQRDSDGALWFGTWGRGVYRYDGKSLLNFTQKDGLQSNAIFPSHCTPDGMMWFWTPPGWFSRYDGKEFQNFTEKDALVNNYEAFVNLKSHHNLPIYRAPKAGLWPIHRAPKGGLWLARSLWGWRDGVVGYNGKKFVNFTTADGLPHNRVESIQSTSDGVVWFGMWGGGIASYDGKGLINFTTQDGLLSNIVKHLYIDPDGVIWVATGSAILGSERGGLSRYDPRRFVNFTTRDGLPSNAISTLQRSSDGALWIGTCGGGISRYDGKKFLNFTTKNGLVGNYVTTMALDADGIFWFGTGARHVPGNGVSRYDTKTGKFLQPLTTKEGLASNTILSIFTAADGIVWFGTTAGISRYDTRSGKFLQPLTIQDGLASDNVSAIYCDPDGMMWFDSRFAGVTRYDGNQFTNFEYREGMIRLTKAFHRDEDKVIWSRLFGLGVGRYDGNQFVPITQKAGLPDNQIGVIYPNINGIGVAASDEVIWLGTDSKGVSFYDGMAWSSLDTQDGLAGNTVTSIVQDAGGSLWFGTQDGGLTRYRRTSSRPKIHIVSVTTDKTYRDLDDIPSLTTGTRVTIEYNAIDFKTIPAKRQYRYCIRELDEDWLRPTKETSVDYSLSQPGEYTFEVQAIDRDLNYSLPASLTLKVVPPWYLNGWILFPSGGGILALLIWAIVSGVRYSAQRRESQRLEQEAQQLRDRMLEQERQSRQEVEAKNEQISALNEQLNDENLRMAAELEITERIQRMILPSADELKSIANLDIAGYMEPADDVGGDYYDVMQREGTVAISIGDVTGHGLESGLVMLMTQTAMQALLHSGETDPVHLLDSLNRTIYNNVQRIKTDKNLTLCLLDYQSGELKLSGQHEEMIVVRQDGQVELIDTIDLGFPIGLDDDIADLINQTTVQLQSGDGVVLYTDGITEAENTDSEQYGLERLCEVVSRHWSQSAEDIKEAVIADVRSHIGGQEVYDDITLIVLKQK